MKRKVITTGDGSKTIQIEDWNEQYHSVHGAINEANHVFIKHGLLFYSEINPETKPIHILEIGFGTGLNAFLTLINAEKLHKNIRYTGVEAYPVSQEEINALNYVDLISKHHKNEFELLHSTEWEKDIDIFPNFSLIKRQMLIQDISTISEFDVIYFDAFGARVQPDLWTEDIFQNMYNALNTNGVLVTYSAKGSVRRAMKSVGFKVERLDGPPNKRHMLRAVKS
ncbi:MAG: SAM-dependent methyltransferase [Winogradskyella sp.]|uniref:tRNA (5-methylaminomethyl-2-thiouridine)(34)-methyltransferase MnmD n=1 Tax=Winogradskyella sp. TaxID=1883156 RepID=UPI000F3E6A82|nr:tRNA (5-methylaminomethyl-2-thiouridine)(34)-methyltransferase MnmD [Winogradskyella sp.]RNC86763.1 MAG: SAM-dependent methyltransferase [Winogradskyella sp.]